MQGQNPDHLAKSAENRGSRVAVTVLQHYVFFFFRGSGLVLDPVDPFSL